MSLNQFTVRLGDFYKSKYKDPLNDDIGAFGPIDEDTGDFLHYNKIIDQQFNAPFEQMHLKSDVSDDFKKEFAKRFWDREIGFETMNEFLRHLESDINTKYFNVFRVMDRIRDMSQDDMQKDHDNRVDTLTNANAQNLNIVNTSPQNRREILFTDKYGVIEYANSLVEDHNKNASDVNMHSYGWSADSQFTDFNDMALVADLMEIVLDGMEDLFMGVWL